MPTSYARYSAAVKTMRGVASRSIAGSSARDWREVFLRATQGGQAPAALASDQRLEPGMNQGRLFLDSGKLGGPLQQGFVDVQSRPHMYKYARMMQTSPCPSLSSFATLLLRAWGTTRQDAGLERMGWPPGASRPRKGGRIIGKLSRALRVARSLDARRVGGPPPQASSDSQQHAGQETPRHE